MLRLKELYAGASLDIACLIVTSALIGALYWSLLDLRLVLAWVTVAAIIIVHRTFLLRAFLRSESAPLDAAWLKKYETSALCSGISWGAIYSYSAITLPAVHVTAFTLVLGALVTVPLATYFTQWSIYVRFSIPAMLVPIIVLFSTGEPLKCVLALLTLGWFVVTNQNAHILTTQRSRLAAFRCEKHNKTLGEIDALLAQNEKARQEIKQNSQLISMLRSDSDNLTPDTRTNGGER